MISRESRVGVLGGTFDPIHLGHLAVADAAFDALDLARVLVVPSNHPPHRRVDPQASGYHRFAMVALALSDRPRMVGSDVELQAESRSYTSVTLRRLQQDAITPLQLFFLTGADAFAEIATWNEYPGILDLSNFVVVSRPGHAARSMIDHLPALRDRMVVCAPAGGGQRDDAADGPRIYLVDAPTPDVSSTEVRRRARAGESLEGLVPALVGEYIERQQLYR